MRALRRFYREFDEEQRQHRKDERLYEADEHLEPHQRRREHIRKEEYGDQHHHFARENVPEETERERDEPTEIAHELDEPDNKPDRRLQINILSRIFEKTEHRDARDLDGEEGDESEREGEVEVGGRRAQNRQEFGRVYRAERADTREELQLIDKSDEYEDGRDEREEPPGEFLALEHLGHIGEDTLESPLDARLDFTRNQRKRTAEEERETDKEHHHEPGHHKRVSDGETENGAQLLRLED